MVAPSARQQSSVLYPETLRAQCSVTTRHHQKKDDNILKQNVRLETLRDYSTITRQHSQIQFGIYCFDIRLVLENPFWII